MWWSKGHHFIDLLALQSSITNAQAIGGNQITPLAVTSWLAHLSFHTLSLTNWLFCFYVFSVYFLPFSAFFLSFWKVNWSFFLPIELSGYSTPTQPCYDINISNYSNFMAAFWFLPSGKLVNVKNYEGFQYSNCTLSWGCFVVFRASKHAFY